MNPLVRSWAAYAYNKILNDALIDKWELSLKGYKLIEERNEIKVVLLK